MEKVMNLLSMRVLRKTNEADGICSFELIAESGEELPAFTAGAHLDVQIPGPENFVRQYSLANSPADRKRYLIGVLLDASGRGGSRSMHERVNEGDLLRVSPPKNHFPLVPDTRSALILAGGIGVTPLLAMAEELHRNHVSFDFHYAARSVARMAFRERLEKSPYRERVHFYLDDQSSGQPLNLTTILSTPNPGVHLYICGPRGFLDAAIGVAHASGWSEAQIHFEAFSNQVQEAGDAFDLRLARSERIIRVGANEPVIHALSRNGIEVPTSCEQGVCGTCLTRVISGIPDHRDMYLTQQERERNDQFLPCCSRSRSSILVVDL
ncbi:MULTISPECIES: PDR/VanB family oxidoreductase [Paraburkholderia]|uniref:PDR/VanB family oxidoreductase n=1 Tax=Paraburkholderia TaxID=1822464 RepID=UPI0038B6C5F5